jgi:trigger factor
MLVKQEQLNACEVELEIQVDAEKVQSAVDDIYSELGKRVNIPGFRKGKAPRAILEQFLDRDEVKERAANRLIRGAYPEALDESKLEPYAPADVELVRMEVGEPMVFKAKVPLPPKVELGEYVGLEIERRVPEVKDEHVDAEINRMLERRAEYPLVTDRPVQEGDVLAVEITDETNPAQGPRRQVAEVGTNLADFDNGVVGMRTGEEKVIDITYPDDHGDEELRGKTVPLRVKILEINEKRLPELTDEWVKATFEPEPEEPQESTEADAPGETELEDEKLDTVEKLRARVRASMEKAALDVADEAVRESVVQKVVEGAEVCFPDVMLEEAVDSRVENLSENLKKRRVTLDNYLNYIGETMGDLRRRYAEESREALKTILVLREILHRENIEVKEEDINAEIEEMAAEQGVPVATMNAYLDRTDGRERLYNRVARKKVVDFLVHASNITNVSGEEAAAESKGRKAKKSKT